ncbi:dihydroorotase [Bacillus fonticola]|uniref:dihydroorotase n=1 Tax=Bacillus fonticola TaxID=2728853 RepID=UPI00147650B0|nr:dihydroorotase [Bacillus fonticola]
MKKVLRNVLVLRDNNEWKGQDVWIEGEHIVAVTTPYELATQNAQEIDGTGLHCSPGLIDVHIHLREPGGEAKETIATGTASAAKGGFTHVFPMPNTNPTPDSAEKLQAFQKRVEETAVVRVSPYGSITKQLAGAELVPFNEMTDCIAFTDDGKGVQNPATMLEAMKRAAHLQKPIVAHCEEEALVAEGGVFHEGAVSERFGIPGISSLSESIHVGRDILLAEESGCRYHVCHVSTKESVRLIRDAKTAGIPVTAEVSPHHLLLCEDDITEISGHYKMNPPLRSKEDQAALLEGLLDGTIDCVATDHAPHTPAEKEGEITTAPFGVVGLEFAFSVLYTNLVLPGTLSLERLLESLTTVPRNIFNVQQVIIEPGSVADITLLDLQKKQTIQPDNFATKGRHTPFSGWDVQGIPVMTIVGGHIVFEEVRV